MTERRPPPSLGTYRPTQDSARDHRPGGQSDHRPDPAQQPERTWEDPDGMPRIVTSRHRDGQRTAPPPPPGPPARPRRALPPPPMEPEGMSGLRIVIYCIFGLFAFMAAAAVAGFLLIPTDLIRDRLQTEVKARTGRDLVIAGSTSLALWPRPAVSLRDVTLSSPPDMGAQPLLRVAEIEVAVQILPLLLHDVSVDRLVLRRPELNLRIDPQGRRSWDFAELRPLDLPAPRVRLAQAATGDAKSLPKELQDFMRGSSGTGAPAAGKSRIGDVSLGNVSIVDGSVRYIDARSAIDETVSAVNAQLSLANIASPLDVRSDFQWRREPVVLTAQISPFRALLDGRPIEARLTADAAPLKIGFDGNITLGGDLDLDGRITATAPALDRLSQWTGRPLAGALPGGFSVAAKLKQTSAITALSDAEMSLGALKGNGTLSVDSRGARPYVKGAFRVATLDLNLLRVVAEVTPATAASRPPALPAAQTSTAAPEKPKSIEDLLLDTPTAPPPMVPPKQVRGYTKRQGWSDDAIDLTVLGLADADVKLGFDRIVWQDLSTGGGQINVALKSKAVRVTLEDLALYEGRARGIVTVDANAAEPTFGANLLAEGVSALPFLKAFADFDWLSGRARIAIAAAGRGATERQVVSTLNGKADIAIADGALMGLNVPAIMRNLGRGKLAGLDRSPGEKTDFTEFAASTQIANGLARNDDLRITSAQIKATGAGSIDLPQRTMDYLLRPKIVTGTSTGIDVPLRIQGSLDKPTVTPELAGVLRDPAQAVQAIQEAAKTPAGREVQETIKGALNGDPAAKDKVKNFFDQLLKK